MSATLISFLTSGGVLIISLFWLWLMVRIWERFDD